MKIPKKCKILQQNNKWDWTNLTRKNKNIYVYTTIGKLPSVDFSQKFASLSLPQTESASVPSLIQLSAVLHFICYSGITQIDKKNAKSINNRE